MLLNLYSLASIEANGNKTNGENERNPNSFNDKN